jgi:hypothetical protein
LSSLVTARNCKRSSIVSCDSCWSCNLQSSIKAGLRGLNVCWFSNSSVNSLLAHADPLYAMLCCSVETSLVATLVIKVSSCIEDELFSLAASQYPVFLPPVSYWLPVPLEAARVEVSYKDDKLESRLNMRFRCFFKIMYVPSPESLNLKSLR